MRVRLETYALAEGRGRPGGRRARRPTRGRPPRPARGRRLSKSATKAPTEPRRARRIVDIPRLRSPPIPARGAFVADLDNPPPRTPQKRGAAGRSGPRRAPPIPRGALRTRECSSNRRSRERNAPLDEEEVGRGHRGSAAPTPPRNISSDPMRKALSGPRRGAISLPSAPRGLRSFDPVPSSFNLNAQFEFDGLFARIFSKITADSDVAQVYVPTEQRGQNPSGRLVRR